MNKYEKLIEYIVNDEQDKARALFHDIVVEKSRGIYESLMDEEQYEEGMGGNAVEDMVDEVSADEEGMQEAEDDDMDDMGDDMGGDDDMGMDDMPDMGGDDMGGEGELEDRVMDLEAALDELKAEFDAMMSDENGDDMDDMDMGSDDDEDMQMNSMMEQEEEEEEEEEEVEESRRHISAADQIREYVEKVSDGHGAEKKGGAEGHEVGKGGSVSVNKNHIVAGKNDMGGTAANIVKGGSEQAPDGTSPKGKVGGFVKKGPDLIGDVENRVNSKTKGYTNKQSASKGEEGGVNKTSIESGKK